MTTLIKSDYLYKTMKDLLNKHHKDALLLSSKQVHEKVYLFINNIIQELLEYIRITETFTAKDTLTVMPSLVSDPNKFFELLSSIVGSNIMKIPYE